MSYSRDDAERILSTYWQLRHKYNCIIQSKSGLGGDSKVGDGQNEKKTSSVERALMLMQDSQTQELQNKIRAVEKILSQTNDRQKRIIYLLYWQNNNITDVANKLGVVRQTIYNHKQEILNNLKKKLNSA